jgi:4-amino-4-deoxy-L-arabinose transferase-like glycosyltransferase/Tfp pilus assembly protein PilF
MQIKPRYITLAAVILLAIFYVRIFSTISVKSDTYDELKCLNAGEYLAQYGKWDTASVIFHPPLSYITHGYLLKDIQFDNNDEKIFRARMIMAVFPVLLGFFIFRFGKKEFGPLAGLAALFLYTFEPNVLAQSCLIQPDMFAATFMFLAFYAYLRSMRAPKSSGKLLLAGIVMGLAFLSKYNGVFMLFVALFLEAKDVWRKSSAPKASAKRLAYVAVIAVFVLNLGYGFAGSFKMLKDFNFQSGFFSALSSAPVVSLIPAPLPEPYLQGFDAQKKIAEAGHPTFLMGERSVKGWWYYFPVAFLIKVPIPLIILFIISLLYRPSKKLDLLIPLAALTLPFILMTNSNPGVRYLLPAFPFIFLLVGGLAEAKLSGVKQALMGLMFLWFAFESVTIHPHYLAYFNEFIGGPKNGWKYLADSNIDWGQDRLLATQYLQKNPTVKINPEEPLPGSYLINVNNLQDVFRIKDQHRWLRYFKPAGYVGYSWLIYDIKADDFRKLAASLPANAYVKYACGYATGDIGMISEAVALDPGLSDAGQKLAEYYLSKGENGKAEEQFRAIIKNDPGSYMAYRYVGWLLGKKGKWEEARAYDRAYKAARALSSYAVKVSTDESIYRENIKREPADAKSWNNLGFVLWMKGDPAGASDCFKKAYSLKPYFLDYLVNLLVSYDERGMKKSAEYLDLVAEYRKKYSLPSTSRVSIVQYGEHKMILEDVLLLTAE